MVPGQTAPLGADGRGPKVTTIIADAEQLAKEIIKTATAAGDKVLGDPRDQVDVRSAPKPARLLHGENDALGP